MKRRTERAHAREAKRANPANKPPRIKCVGCGHTFGSDYELRRHKRLSGE